PSHRRNIEELNLLNPKKEAIININQEISFRNHMKYKFNFSLKELQEIILYKFDRIDYKSVNTIINYISDLFFENSYLNDFNSNTTYIYQHRRYQEYFFTQRLRLEYEKNPKILRDLRILSDHEYLEELFLKYLRREYKKENNLVGLVELNLINVYLGKYNSYGTGKENYGNPIEFLPALVCQGQDNFDILYEEFKVRDKISLNIREIIEKFKMWENE